MSQLAPPRPATSRPVVRMILAGIALTWDTAVCATVVVDLILSGWHIEPSPLWSFGVTAATILTLSSVMLEMAARIAASRQRDTDRIMTRIDLLEERSALFGYPEGYADGLARRPAAPSPRRLNSVDS